MRKVDIIENTSGHITPVSLSGLEPSDLNTVLALAGKRLPVGSSCFVNGQMVPLYGPGTPVTVKPGDEIIVADNIHIQPAPRWVV